jgi:hypothetical protein
MVPAKRCCHANALAYRKVGTYDLIAVADNAERFQQIIDDREDNERKATCHRATFAATKAHLISSQ